MNPLPVVQASLRRFPLVSLATLLLVAVAVGLGTSVSLLEPSLRRGATAAADKFDFQLIEAAKDLGATSFRAFRSIFLPGIRVGLLTAFLMVFIPSLGSYVIPDIVGGPTSEMVGNKIAQRTFVDRNLPHAAGLSAILAVAVLAPLLAIASLRRRESPRDALREEGV